MTTRPLHAAGLVLGLTVLTVAAACAADESPAPNGRFEKIHVINFEGDIEAIMSTYIARRIETAKEAGADCVVLRIDSPGGTVFHSKEIGDLLIEQPDSLHVVAWVPKMALSGAAWVSLACDEIVMAPGATMGDAQPITAGVEGTPKPVGEKIESPLRAWFTAYARKNGYPVLLAQAMVSDRMEVIRVRPRAGGEPFFMEGDEFRKADDEAELVPGLRKSDLIQVGTTVVGKGELLTMTAEEALDYGFIKRRHEGGLFADEDDLLAALKAPGATVTFTAMSFSEKASKVLLTISGILSAVVAMAILVFMWQGPGVMTIVGGVALVLIILINVSAEQLHGFPIFLVLLGVALLAVEVFLFPGFGIPGIAGIVSMAAGFLFLATGSGLGSTDRITSDALLSFGLQFTFTAIAVFAVMLALSRFVPKVGPARRMVLQTAGGPSAIAVPDTAPPPGIGTTGVTLSPLRPAGSAEFGGTLTDVVSDGSFIAGGVRVEVVAVEGDRVTVRATGQEDEGSA